jgi:hypothetical protein
MTPEIAIIPLLVAERRRRADADRIDRLTACCLRLPLRDRLVGRVR